MTGVSSSGGLDGYDEDGMEGVLVGSLGGGSGGVGMESVQALERVVGSGVLRQGVEDEGKEKKMEEEEK